MWLALLWPLLLGPADLGQAPDGSPGFGPEPSAARLLELVRQPEPEEEAFLRDLLDVESRLGVLVATTLADYRSRGYDVALGVEGLAGGWAEAIDGFLARPMDFLAVRELDARSVAAIFWDVRLRVRHAVLRGWKEDAEEVRRGLALLRGHGDGWVRLEDDQLEDVAVRLDLAAALLRARFKDLEALRQSPEGRDQVPAESIEAWLACAAASSDEREACLAALEAEVQASVEAMLSMTFSRRLAAKTEALRKWRTTRRSAGRAELAQVEIWNPDTATEAPREITRHKKTDRRREAYRRARLGLAHDPLNSELAYHAATLGRLLAGTLDTLSHYDHYLALRGIRVHQVSWKDLDLSDREEEAILFIQQVQSELGTPEGE